MSMRSWLPPDRPIRYLPERRREPRNGNTDPRRGHPETIIEDVIQTVIAHRLGLYLAFLAAVSVLVGILT